jgi:cytochrome c
MGDLFWNKVIGALLATALGIFGIKELGHALIHSPEPAVPGYKIAVADAAGSKEKEVKTVEVASLAQLLSEASATKGERVAKKCAACHDFTKGGRNKIGPNLWNVLGRQSASHEGFSYSQAMRDFGGVWDFDNLNAFLTKPKGLVPGTAMGFAGLKNATDSANLLMYLRSLSDAPLPLPAVSVVDMKNAAEAEKHKWVDEERKPE